MLARLNPAFLLPFQLDVSNATSTNGNNHGPHNEEGTDTSYRQLVSMALVSAQPRNHHFIIAAIFLKLISDVHP